MALFFRFINGVRAVFQKSRVEQELDAELQEFLESAVEQNMRAGLTRDEAVRAARLKLGSVAAVKDRVRDTGWESVLEDFWQDVRYGSRMLRRSPGFAAVAIAILALGIGSNTAIFSLVNTVILRELPVREPKQLVQLLSRFPGEPRGGFSWKVYEHFRDHNHVFSDLIAVSPSRFQVTPRGRDEEGVYGEYVVGTLFPALGVQPAIGRLIGPEDDQLGSASAAVAVLSWSYWRSRFNLDPAILGTRIVVQGVPVSVIGVAPREFVGLQTGVTPAMWLPVAAEPIIQRPGRRADGSLGIGIMGRLKPGVSIEQAQAEMSVLDQWRLEQIAKTSSASFARQFTIELESAAAGFSRLREHFAKPLVALMAVVGLLLLLACINVASMLLARGAARQQEMAVRVSLGAGRSRLMRQVLTESLLLSAAGGLLGIGLAYVGADALVRIIGSGRRFPSMPERLEIPIEPDAQVLLFTAALALCTAVLFGLAPGWHAFSSAPASSLRETARAGETRSRRMFGKSLVVAQVALSIVLLSAAGVFVRHLSNLRSLNLGFERDSVLLVTLDPSRSGYERTQLSHLYEELLGRLQAIPGVRAATLSGATPIQGAGASRFVNVEGFEEREARRYVSLNWVGPRYFETLGTPMLAGRDFTLADEGPARVAIVNQAMARYYFGDGSPIGQRFTFEGQATPYEIVGVVANAKYLSLHEAAPRTIYLNAFQDARGLSQQFALRTNGPPTAVAGDVQRIVREVLKTVSVAKVTTLAEQVDASIVPERLIALVSGFFGALGALLAAIGLYGLLAFTVARRTNEIGVRMALGATERDVTRMVLRGALGLVCVGLAAGLPIAIWSKRLAASLIAGMNLWDQVENLPVQTALPVAVAALTMIGVALVAAYVPARRAARVQPMDALRHS